MVLIWNVSEGSCIEGLIPYAVVFRWGALGKWLYIKDSDLITGDLVDYWEAVRIRRRAVTAGRSTQGCVLGCSVSSLGHSSSYPLTSCFLNTMSRVAFLVILSLLWCSVLPQAHWLQMPQCVSKVNPYPFQLSCFQPFCHNNGKLT